LPGWNVPPDTVVRITILLKKERQFSELETNVDDFVKTIDDRHLAWLQ
jgi:hypothetical protein